MLTLEDRLALSRPPLEVALGWSLKLVESVSEAHREGLVFGRLSTQDVMVDPDGPVRIVANPQSGRDVSHDIFELGRVLSRLLAAAPSERRSFIERNIDYVLGLMLEAVPERRPSSLEVVEELLGDICEEFGG